ncbi:hypothetical protein OSB04_010378 [Centaurea solstitialis]|uniref:Transposase n=1 Tax=Centaurea solstitialis TaxID=347529 RepID=A0AA38T7G4_9ASTR|nr:hypothetical protein OSB04_010378 [Centaurea solstitialis]
MATENAHLYSSSGSPSVGALNSEGTPERSRFGVPPLPTGGHEASSGGKKRKTPSNKSPLWAYFTRLQVPGTDVIDPKWCKCNVCGEHAHTRKCSTHPLRHDAQEVDPKQSKLYGSTMSGGGSGYHKFSKKRCDDRCIDMVIIDELPFRFVEKTGFRAFCKELEPNWTPLGRRQVAKGVLDKFNYEKALLLSQLKENETKVSITTDTWTSIQNINYMVLTAHFLDKDWILHKRIINFCTITSHKGDDIGRAIEQCLRQWEITKVFTITIDNASANDVAVAYMKRRLTSYKTLMFDGEFLHLRCSCHIINLIVKDGLKELEDGVAAIWNCAKYVRSSPQRLEKFREFAILEQCKANANVPLDVITRWNSTYLMLDAALKYEGTFNRMAEEDVPFKSYFQDKVGPPCNDDWRNAQAFCVFLKMFYEATLKLSAWKSITSNILFVEMITLQTEIDKALYSTDEVLKRVARSMKAKFNKYWGSFEKTNKIVMIANVLDPRYKLQWAKVAMQKVYASDEVIQSIEGELKRLLMKMYEEYKRLENGEQHDHTVLEDSDMDGDELEGLDEVSREIARERMSQQSGCIRNEVDQYLSDMYVSLVAKNFELHKWWKGNESTYPVLSKLAKDIFAIPCSTVASENAFSLGSRVVDPFRASLTPKTVEALVCTTDWLRASPPNFNFYEDPMEEALEIYNELEELERENAYNQGYEATTNLSGQTTV